MLANTGWADKILVIAWIRAAPTTSKSNIHSLQRQLQESGLKARRGLLRSDEYWIPPDLVTFTPRVAALTGEVTRIKRSR